MAPRPVLVVVLEREGGAVLVGAVEVELARVGTEEGSDSGGDTERRSHGGDGGTLAGELVGDGRGATTRTLSGVCIHGKTMVSSALIAEWY